MIAAHNEEKLISQALDGLVSLYKDYPKIEVLVGLDGCTDKTPEIVKEFSEKYKFFKPFDLNERKGKQAVIEKLEPYVKGDIIIIHDADWKFVYRSKKDLLEFISLFDDKKLGGIADSIDTEMSREDFWEIRSLGFLASAWGNHILTKYMKEKFTENKKNLRFYIKDKIKFYPFLDVYRKEAMDKTRHKSGLRAGDHVERTLRIFKAGYEIATHDNKNWPHFNVTYNEQTIKDLIKQKIRGVIAKRKIQTAYSYKIPLLGFYFPFLFYNIKESLKVKRFRDFFSIYTYLFVMFYAIAFSKIKEASSTKQVWKMRIKR